MYTVFEIKSKKGGARQVEFNKIGELIQIDHQKNTKPGDKIIFDKVLSCEGKEEEEANQENGNAGKEFEIRISFLFSCFPN